MSSFIYYVYAYIRSKPSKNGRFSAGTPYYIGKGKGNRVYSKLGHPGLPKDRQYIVFLEKNLSEIAAFAFERRYIKWYGRIDLETGCLHNKTDGGEGVSGWSKERRLNKSLEKQNKTMAIVNGKSVLVDLETFQSMNLEGHTKGKSVYKDDYGNKIYLDNTDKRVIDGNVKGHKSGMCTYVDKCGNKVYTNTTDDRVISGELVSSNLSSNSIVIDNSNNHNINKHHLSKSYRIRTPDGDIIDVLGLKPWCDSTFSNGSSARSSFRQRGKYLGYIIEQSHIDILTL